MKFLTETMMNEIKLLVAEKSGFDNGDVSMLTAFFDQFELLRLWRRKLVTHEYDFMQSGNLETTKRNVSVAKNIEIFLKVCFFGSRQTGRAKKTAAIKLKKVKLFSFFLNFINRFLRCLASYHRKNVSSIVLNF